MERVHKFRWAEKQAKWVGMRSKWARQKSTPEAVLKSAPMKQATVPAIPGVDILDAKVPGSRAIAGPFYSDQIATLCDAARNVRDRAKAGRVYIAPEGEGFTIYRRALSK